MDIVIHGTKGGRKIFTPNKLAGLLDVNSDSPKATSIGQKAYAIRLIEDKLIFSQYKIVRDVRGDKRTGFVGFSLFIHKSKKLNGSEVVTLLDLISDEYCQRFITDNNLSEVTENWDFLDDFSSKYETSSRLSDENFLSGVKDDAFIYFNGLEELKSFFDAPYQEEYQPYRQILFINKELEGKPENPLNALRNSGIDLTGKIDLENPKYKLQFNANAKDDVKISVKINGGTVSSGYKFKRKNELEISWTKQYYETEIHRGKCFELADKFINIDKEAEKVTIKEIELQPEERKIKFDIKDRNGNPINDAVILVENKFESISKEITSATALVPFVGEKLGKSWIVTAIKGENLISEPHRIDFEKDCVGNVELILNEKKVLQIIAHKERLDGDVINNIQISKTIFTNNEINQPHTITVTCNGYNTYSFDYLPIKDENPKHISLQKRNQQNERMYKVSAGNHGKLKNNNNYSSYKSDGSDLDPNCVIPDKGWKFDCWRNDNDKLVAQYKKAPLFKRPIYIVASIVFVIAISFGIWKIIPNENSEPLQVEVNSDSILNYLLGNELLKDSLIKYRKAWEEQFDTQHVELEEEKSTFIETIKGFFGGKKEQESSYVQSILPEGVDYETVLQKIDSAIDLRDSINELNFEYLKRYNYSEEQKDFEKAIQSVNSKDYDFVKKEINPVEMTLFDIANSINNILKTKKTEQSPTTEKVVKEIGKPEKPLLDNKNIDKKNPSKKNEGPKLNNKDEDIKSYLKGSVLKKNELNDFLNQTKDKDLKKSINLCLTLWELKGTEDNSYYSIQKKCDSDNILKNSDLNTILKKINSKTTAIEYAGLATSTNIMTKLKDKAK